jgi:dipeptidyl aminopeptidase/acylaminoacyl peptidase
MKIIENKFLIGNAARVFGFDLYLPDSFNHSESFPLLIFAHGFKGFKDWGHWQKMAEGFAVHGFAFLKFNFSHNGTSPQNPTEFSDLEAFGNNNFSKELADLKTVIDWVWENAAEYRLDKSRICIVGHSRGGPIALLTAAKDERIAALITWASVHELDYAWQDAEQLKNWKENGVQYSLNARTGQQMPLYYQLYEDFAAHAAEYSVKQALSGFKKPMLIVHGTADPAVKLSSAEYLIKYAPHAEYLLIEGADHVFGGRHPFPEREELPVHSKILLNSCLDFLRAQAPASDLTTF